MPVSEIVQEDLMMMSTAASGEGEVEILWSALVVRNRWVIA